MMSKRRYLTVVILIAVAYLFLNINWGCSHNSFEAASYEATFYKGQRLGKLLYIEECSTDILSQELIDSRFIQIPKNISSYISFKQNQLYIQIPKLQLEKNYSLWLPFSWPKSKVSKAQTYILNSSYLL